MAKSTSATDHRGGRAAQSLTGRETLVVGIFMMGLAGFLGYALLTVWPSSSVEKGVVIWSGLTENIGLSIAMIAGALGSFIHVATSFTSFAGNRSLSASWVWWFILRPPMGAAIALLAYFVLRSGLLLDGQLGVQVSPFGIAALGGMIGLFSKQIIDKLRSVADTTFNTPQDENRADKL